MPRRSLRRCWELMFVGSGWKLHHEYGRSGRVIGCQRRSPPVWPQARCTETQGDNPHKLRLPSRRACSETGQTYPGKSVRGPLIFPSAW